MQSVPITSDVVGSNLVLGEMYNICLIKFVIVRWFSPGTLVSSTNKLTVTI